jgi:thiol-disulfide isomerase/thioredoxin
MSKPVTIAGGVIAVMIVVLLVLFSRPDVANTNTVTLDRPVAENTATPNNTDTDTTTTDTTTTDTTTTDTTSVNIDRPAWQTLPLVDARTGETFTFADFDGKTVFVEPMATWCSNCRQQLGNVNSARASFDSEQVVFVALSVEVGLGNDTLSTYSQNNGFDWHFAVITPELLAELVATFGRTITNPPSTPHFIIRPDGTTTSLTTGIHSVDELVAEIRTEGGL